jgi:hypothetical protein
VVIEEGCGVLSVSILLRKGCTILYRRGFLEIYFELLNNDQLVFPRLLHSCLTLLALDFLRHHSVTLRRKMMPSSEGCYKSGGKPQEARSQGRAAILAKRRFCRPALSLAGKMVQFIRIVHILADTPVVRNTAINAQAPFREPWGGRRIVNSVFLA